MRASEFLIEKKAQQGRLTNSQAATMNPVHKFAGTADRIYDLNRVMMAMAAADHNSAGENAPDEESWTGRNNTCHPWTKEEHRMMHHAYKHLGIENEDAVNNWSVEPDHVQKNSPVVAFKGYPR
jgi:hypothetical protein